MFRVDPEASLKAFQLYHILCMHYMGRLGLHYAEIGAHTKPVNLVLVTPIGHTTGPEQGN